MKHIECGRCSKSYPVIFEADSTQARTCSAEVAQGRLVGHYGSEIADMRVFDFAGAPPKEGTIFCDDCIRRGLRRGHSSGGRWTPGIQHHAGRVRPDDQASG